ncbi:hypothetical protein [Stenotrophomonas sp. NPDC077461]|uniref:hypothetical protein n=1 Tax=Stenotrophomonas sp. NPDC077461 TaxID=3414698 RepID=UPI003C2F3566
MRERPILFNGAMVRAILAGQKTQTRRVVKGHALDWLGKAQFTPEYVASPGNDLCPFGQPGDRLWVREAHAIFPTHGQHRADGERWGPWSGLPTTISPMGGEIAYYREGFDRCGPGRWRPSIHMPRWACRLVLEITAVRVERIQAISTQDCLAEGITTRFKVADAADELRIQFRDLWNDTGGDWDSNPWVWVIEFKRAEVTGD